ncbi:hypothetical protein HOY80DRAFT_873363, partial [Tuber brumale]
LDNKYLRLYKIVIKVGNETYYLKLLTSMNIHDIFYVSLLDSVGEDSLPGQ